jgi:hypothetical protein
MSTLIFLWATLLALISLVFGKVDHKKITDFGYNNIKIDTKEIPNGSYFVILQTPNIR